MSPRKSSKKAAHKPAVKKQTVRYGDFDHYALVEQAARRLDVSLNTFIKQASLEKAKAVLAVENNPSISRLYPQAPTAARG